MPFSMLDGTSGTVVESVGNYSQNPFGAKDMSFEYQFNVSSGVVEHISGASFSGFQTDVAQVMGTGPLGLAGNVGIDHASRTAPPGRVVEWNYSANGVGPGGISYILMVNTDALDFGTGTLGLLDGGGAQFLGYAPASPTPEPASFILFGGTLIGVVCGAICRRSKTGTVLA
jgi:hypothetical protein